MGMGAQRAQKSGLPSAVLDNDGRRWVRHKCHSLGRLLIRGSFTSIDRAYDGFMKGASYMTAVAPEVIPTETTDRSGSYLNHKQLNIRPTNMMSTPTAM
jgi:hypothetical protein